VVYDACRVAFLDVKGCLKDVFRGVLGHGKSPCFSRCRVLSLIGRLASVNFLCC